MFQVHRPAAPRAGRFASNLIVSAALAAALISMSVATEASAQGSAWAGAGTTPVSRNLSNKSKNWSRHRPGSGRLTAAGRGAVGDSSNTTGVQGKRDGAGSVGRPRAKRILVKRHRIQPAAGRGAVGDSSNITGVRGKRDGAGSVERRPAKRILVNRHRIQPPEFASDHVINQVTAGAPVVGPGAATPARRRLGGAPPVAEPSYVPDEVVIELAADTTDQAAEALARRFRLTRLESFDFQLAGTKLYRWRISDRRSVPAVVRALEGDRNVISASPNYIMRLQGGASAAPAAPSLEQYALAKLQVPQAHALAQGGKVLIAIIDSGVDTSHLELAGVIADSFDAIGMGEKTHPHGTAVAGAIAAQARLKGTAPAALILAARAFGVGRDKSESTTFYVVKAIDWAIARGARIINMSFGGARDPKIEFSLKQARAKGVILVAAAGNKGPRSRPLYPAADPNVIAVTATDEDDRLFHAANRGGHIAVAAPGVELWLPGLNGTYQEVSGTSFAAAEVAGAVALLLERKSDLSHDDVRRILMSTARDLGPRGVDPQFGAGLVDAYQALVSVAPSKLGSSTVGAVSKHN